MFRFGVTTNYYLDFLFLFVVLEFTIFPETNLSLDFSDLYILFFIQLFDLYLIFPLKRQDKEW